MFLHNLLNVLVQIANKMGSQKKVVKTGPGAHPASYSVGTAGTFPGDKAAGDVKLTTQFHLVTRLRKREFIHPLLPYVIMVWCLVENRDEFIFDI
jgi:hypothetical protein